MKVVWMIRLGFESPTYRMRGLCSNHTATRTTIADMIWRKFLGGGKDGTMGFEYKSAMLRIEKGPLDWRVFRPTINFEDTTNFLIQTYDFTQTLDFRQSSLYAELHNNRG